MALPEELRVLLRSFRLDWLGTPGGLCQVTGGCFVLHVPHIQPTPAVCAPPRPVSLPSASSWKPTLFSCPASPQLCPARRGETGPMAPSWGTKAVLTHPALAPGKTERATAGERGTQLGLTWFISLSVLQVAEVGKARRVTSVQAFLSSDSLISRAVTERRAVEGTPGTPAPTAVLKPLLQRHWIGRGPWQPGATPLAFGAHWPLSAETQRPPEAPRRQDGLGRWQDWYFLTEALSLASISPPTQQGHTAGRTAAHPFPWVKPVASLECGCCLLCFVP